jgi:Mn2+/Fe2+ NRAMP family transporter
MFKTTPKYIYKRLGPGLLYAGAAVGVSHLVHSTRAGAEFGYSLLVVVLFANILKYPFFEAGTRYAVATKRNLIQAYADLGRPYLLIFSIITLLTVFTAQAAVTVVTAGIAESIFQTDLGLPTISLIILGILGTILIIGSFGVFEKAMKGIIILLSLTTVVAAIFAALNAPAVDYFPEFKFNEGGWVMLIALVGWMPAPLDLSVWSSIWTLEKNASSEKMCSLWSFDFKLGYWGTMVLALLFLSIGALVMFPTGNSFSSSGVQFSNEFIGMYGDVFGKAGGIIIGIAALATMVSTTFTRLEVIPKH